MKDRARKFQGEWRCRAAVLLLCGIGAAGCSMSVPMAGSLPDESPTGSIKRAGRASPFSPQMDVEDWRRAKSALDTALDPQGNGASVAWENPDSGAKGSFVPLAQVYPKGDGICRAFAARVALRGDPERLMHSSACRVNSGDWVIGGVTAVADDKGKRPKTGEKLAERDAGTQLR